MNKLPEEIRMNYLNNYIIRKVEDYQGYVYVTVQEISGQRRQRRDKWNKTIIRATGEPFYYMDEMGDW